MADKVVVDIITNTDQANRNILKLATGIGAASLAVGALIKIGDDLVDAFREQERAEVKLESALRATGNQIGMTADELKAYASELSSATGIADESIISAEALMTTFTKIGGEVFPLAIEAAADMSVMFGQDLQQSVIQLGTALNDPIAGVGRLRRIGISFTEEQKNSIKAYMEQNDLMAAQAVILEELNVEFGGVARQMGTTGLASLEKFNNAVVDFKEVMGGAIVDTIQPFVDVMTKGVTKLRELYVELNEYNKMVKASETQTGSLEDRLAGLYFRLEEIDKAQDRAVLASRRWWEEQMAAELAIEEEIRAVRALLVEQDKMAGYSQMEAEAQAQLTEERARARAELDAYLSLVDQEFSKTSEGQIANLEAEIAMWERYAETAVHTKDEVKAILEEKRDALRALTEEEIDLIDWRIEHEQSRADFQEELWETLGDLQEQQLEEEKERLAELQISYEETFNAIGAKLGEYSETLGEVIAGEKEFAEAMKEITKDIAITLLKALGERAAAEAAVLWATSLVPGGQANIPGAIAMSAASAAAFTAAGVVASFANGGDFITNGPMLMMVGDNPTGRERVTVTPQEKGGGMMGQLEIQFREKELFKIVQKGIDNKKIVVR